MFGSTSTSIIQFIFVAIFMHNVVLAEGVVDDGIIEEEFYLGESLFVGISMVVIAIISSSAYALLTHYVLHPFSLDYASLPFIGIISLVSTYAYCSIIKKFKPRIFHKYPGLEKTLLACDFVMHVLIIEGFTGKGLTPVGLVVYTSLQAVGFAIFMVIQGSIAEERVRIADLPHAIKGIPIAIITFGLMAMAFYPFMNNFF